MPQHDDDSKQEMNRAWRKALLSAERLAHQDKSFLLIEVQAILQKATRDLKQYLQSGTLFESTGLDEFPDDMRKALGVATMEELDQSVAAYEDAVVRSQQQRTTEKRFGG